LSSWTGTIGLRHRGHGSWFWPTAAFGWSTALHRGFGWRWPRRQAWSWALAGHDRTGGARAPGAGHRPLPRAGDPVLLRMAGPDGVGRKRVRPWRRVGPVPMLLAVLGAGLPRGGGVGVHVELCLNAAGENAGQHAAAHV